MNNKPRTPEQLAHLRSIASLGGKATGKLTGECKRRSPQHYQFMNRAKKLHRLIDERLGGLGCDDDRTD